MHGEIRADDVSRREKLKEALGYLAQRRALVRQKNEPSGEYFGLPERKTRSPRRPVRDDVPVPCDSADTFADT